jgi:hypothetical protein
MGDGTPDDRPDLPAVTSPPGPPAELPAAVVERLGFERAAPRQVRRGALAPEARRLFEHLWDGIVGDIYAEVAGIRRTRLLDRALIERVLQRVAKRVEEAERALIVTAVYRPLKSDKEWKHVAVGGFSGAATATAEGLAAYASMGTGATVAIASAVVGELFETYVAASGRTLQYRRAGRSPAPDVVVADLAQAVGLDVAVGRRASLELTRVAARWLGDQIVPRTARRFGRALVPVVGVAAGAGLSSSGVHRVLRLPLRPASEEEVVRLAREVVAADAHLRPSPERPRPRPLGSADGAP